LPLHWQSPQPQLPRRRKRPPSLQSSRTARPRATVLPSRHTVEVDTIAMVLTILSAAMPDGHQLVAHGGLGLALGTVFFASLRSFDPIVRYAT